MVVNIQRWLFGGISHLTKKNPHPLEILIPEKSPFREYPKIFKNPQFPGIKIPNPGDKNPRFRKSPMPGD